MTSCSYNTWSIWCFCHIQNVIAMRIFKRIRVVIAKLLWQPLCYGAALSNPKAYGHVRLKIKPNYSFHVILSHACILKIAKHVRVSNVYKSIWPNVEIRNHPYFYTIIKISYSAVCLLQLLGSGTKFHRTQIYLTKVSFLKRNQNFWVLAIQISKQISILRYNLLK